MLTRGLVLACGLAAGVACAQDWEVGAIGGFGLGRDYTISGPAGTAKAGFANGGVVGGLFGNDSSEHWSGEVRYLYRFSDLKLASGSASPQFGGHTHMFTGDILAHFKGRESKVRPFIAFGGGVKQITGTGSESAAQPVGRLASFTTTNEMLGIVDVGAGVKVSVSKSVRFRVEARNYFSGKPQKVIVAAPGATASGMLNDIVASATVSYTF